jgi:chemotaxis protein CheX
MTTFDVELRLATDLVSIVTDVWDSFLLGGLEVHAQPLAAGLVACASVCLSGAWEGVLMVECEPATAALLSGTLLGLEPEETTDLDVADTLGEVANVIGGNLKNLLPGPTLMSLPVVARSMSPTLVKDAFEACNLCFQWNGQGLRVIVWSASA